MKLTPKQRAELRMKFGGKCAYYGVELQGILLRPANDHIDNLYPACVKCNILKSSGTPEDLRQALSYFASSIPTIQNYSHVHHLMRFNKLTIDATPVVFWFERYEEQKCAIVETASS